MFPLASASPQAATRRSARPDEAGGFDAAPLLKPAAERLLAALVKSLGTMAGPVTTVEGALVGFRTVALRDHLASQRPGSVAAALECGGLGCTMLATLDPALVHTLVELLCGGDGSECRPDEMRPATGLDAQYAHIVATLAAGAVAAEWKEQGFSAVKPLKIEGTPPADICGAATREVGIATLAVTVFGLRGLFALALPPAALQAFAGEATAQAEPASLDPAWSSLLRQEVGRAAVTVEVLLDALPLSLRQLSELKPGQVLALPAEARTRAALVCDGRTLYRGELGQDDDRYSLRIDEIAPFRTSPAPSAARSPIQDLIKA